MLSCGGSGTGTRVSKKPRPWRQRNGLDGFLRSLYAQDSLDRDELAPTSCP